MNDDNQTPWRVIAIVLGVAVAILVIGYLCGWELPADN